MIPIKTLTKAAIGKGVVYIPAHGKREDGMILSWNDKVIFVLFRGDAAPKAVRPENLDWLEWHPLPVA